MTSVDRFESYARMGGDSRYREIAERNLEDFERLNNSVIDLRQSLGRTLSAVEDPYSPPAEYYDIAAELDPTEESRDQACIVGCIFTALYFEAFIYDYAASCLGDQYVRDYVDKLDFMSKWVVVPRLTVGKELERGSEGYATLKQLHKDRNSLVHLKSRQMFPSKDDLIAYLNAREDEIHRTMANCKRALRVVIHELRALDPDHPKLASSLNEVLDFADRASST